MATDSPTVEHEPTIIPVLTRRDCIAEACEHGTDECPTRGATVCLSCSEVDPIGLVARATPWPCSEVRRAD